MARSESTVPCVTETGCAVFDLLEFSTTVGCAILSRKGVVRRTNGLFGSWLGLGESESGSGRVLGESLSRPGDLRALDRALGQGRAERISLLLGPEGQQTLVTGELLPLNGRDTSDVACILHSSASDEILTAGMERNARLEALGSLTSGVAHDFNNLLTILIGNLSLVAEELREQPKQFAKLKSARDAARRGGDLIKQLLSFARQEPVASRPINPAKVIARIAPLIERALGRSITLDLELDEHLGPVKGNSAQLESVIVNLAVNARDAIGDSGCVRIRVAGESDPVQGRTRFGGRMLAIKVSDDGAGMPPDVVKRAFEPYFTTKGEGRGTGLGLSMVKRYAEQFGGSAEIVSRPGAGTTVTLRFPVTSGTIEDSAAMTMPVAALPSGNERIAVLSADEGVCTTIVQILGALGYRCRVVPRADASSVMKAMNRPDLLICDGHGPDSLRQAAGSGTAVLRLASPGGDRDESEPTLQKPFSIPDLALAVRKALDADKP